MLVRVVQRADGGVSIIRPVRDRRDDETDAAYYADVFGLAQERDVTLTGRPYADLDEADVPTDRSQRDLWRLVGGRIVVEDA